VFNLHWKAGVSLAAHQASPRRAAKNSGPIDQQIDFGQRRASRPRQYAAPRKLAGGVAMDSTLNFFHSKSGLVVCLLLAGFGGYLFWTHTGHIMTALPYLLLLACPLMHFFGHGHGHGHQHHGDSGRRNSGS
jgi:hypothetical protein